jgi:hypothetical protein
MPVRKIAMTKLLGFAVPAMFVILSGWVHHLKDDLQALASAGAAQPACVEALKP